jgi:hypothetical protein
MFLGIKKSMRGRPRLTLLERGFPRVWRAKYTQWGVYAFLLFRSNSSECGGVTSVHNGARTVCGGIESRPEFKEVEEQIWKLSRFLL